MRRLKYSLISIGIFCLSCKNIKPTINKFSPFIDTTKFFKKDIASTGFFDLDRTKQNQLGLEDLEKGFDNLQIRVWYDYSLVRNRKLLTIVNKDSAWSATLYNLKVNWDGQTETILSKEIRNIFPKDGWETFITQLVDLGILTLPTMDSIPGLFDSWEDGTTYNIEIATKNQYRFYAYHVPEEFKNKFWQANNFSKILEILDNQLNIN